MCEGGSRNFGPELFRTRSAHRLSAHAKIGFNAERKQRIAECRLGRCALDGHNHMLDKHLRSRMMAARPLPDTTQFLAEPRKGPQNPTAFLFPILVMSTVLVQASSPVRRLVRVRRKV